MSFEPPAGILDIGNATLRVGKLEVAETSGLNQGLQNIVKNDLLITEKETYLANKTWGIKLPTAWVGEFDLKTHDNKYVEFNFYNEGSTSNALGYTLNFKDTTLTLKYDNGNNLASETIPDVSTSTYKKVNVFFERGVIAVYIDGARVLYFKESDTYNSVHGHPGVASRVVSTTGGSFVNIFIEADGSDSAVKDLRIVNGRFISDKTSNVSFIGSLGVGVNNPKESLDIRGNMHLTRVSNVSQVSVDSNVVTEYTGPHDRPLRKYPEVNFPTDLRAGDSPYTQDGYTLEVSSEHGNSASYGASHAFDGVYDDGSWMSAVNSYGVDGTVTGADDGGVTPPAGRDSFDPGTGVIYGSWIDIKLPNKIRLSHFKIQNRDASTHRGPKSGILWAKDKSGSTWYRIHDFSGLPVGQNFQVTVHTNETEKYDQYRLQLTEMHPTSTNPAVAIGEWELYGYEEGSGSLDTTLKTVYNVPATTGTQLEVYYDAKDLADGAVTSVVDSSPNTNTGTGTDVTVSNGAFVFNGTSSRISGAITQGAGAYVHTAGLWYYTNDDPTTLGDYIYQLGSGGTNTSPSIQISSGKLYISFMSNYYEISVSSAGILSKQWVHIFYSYDGSLTTQNSVTVYINGVKMNMTGPLGSSAGSALSLGENPQLRVGCSAGNAGFVNGSIANFRLYSKVLNADQIKELYDYQKDYFLGSKSQVTLYKGHLGVGVTEPSGQLELAGDERIQAYPPRGMTHPDGTATGTHISGVTKNITYIEGHGEFKASASLRSRQDVDYDGNQPYNAFDYNSSESYLLYGPGSQEDVGYNKTTGYYEDNEYQLSASSGTPYGHWLQLEMPYKINVKSYFIQHATDDYWPQDWQIWASNDDINWTHIHTYTGGTFDTDPQYYTVSHTGHYKIYTMIITRIKEGSTLDRVRIQELRYFGTPGPTTLDKGSLSLTRSLDVPRVSRYDVDTETPRPEKLVLDLDTTVNSSPTDISGRGNHGAFYGGAYYSAADKAFVFDGTDDYIEAATNLGSGNQTLCLSMWLKPETDNRWFIDLGKNTDTGGSFFAIRYDTYYKFNIRNGNHLEITAGSLNTWEHLVIIYHGTGSTKTAGTIEGYVNGVPGNVIDSDFADDQLSLSANPPIEIGARTGSSSTDRYFDGQISNFKIYNVALEPSEIKKLYNLGRTGRSMVISDTAVGIGKVPEAQLDVRGNIATRGVISSNNPGWSYWKTGAPDQNDIIYNSATDGPVIFGNLDDFEQSWETGMAGTRTERGTGRNFDPSTGTYTAPEKGVYLVQFCWTMVGGDGTDDSQYAMFVTGGNKANGGSWESGGSFPNRTTNSSAFMQFNPQFLTRTGIEECWCISDLIPLDKGSTVQVHFRNVVATTTLKVNRANFSGIKIA